MEIVKMLYRGASILILDEPTAVLTPQETQRLFQVMRNMRQDGKAVVIITHKLHEVMEVSDRVAVLRRGKFIGDVPTERTNPQKLTEMMVGRSVSLNIHRPERLQVEHLTVRSADGVNKLEDVCFTAYGGEILGVAGISGCGQKELLEAVAGLYPVGPGGQYGHLGQRRLHRAAGLVGGGPGDLRHLAVPERHLGRVSVRRAVLAVFLSAGADPPVSGSFRMLPYLVTILVLIFVSMRRK